MPRLLTSSMSLSLLLLAYINVVVVARDTPRPTLSSTAHGSDLGIDSIYQFGDSISDTGNRIRQNQTDICCAFPYGESFFHYVTGRCSNGLIMADYYATAFGLPFLNPYLDFNATFGNGVDFSVGGATALDTAFLDAHNFTTGGTNSSLSVQVNWFRTHLKSICTSPTECREKVKRGLFLMEAIGGNDYETALAVSFEAAYEIVPDIVRVITNAAKDMIILGAVNILIPGVVPFGCQPSYLAEVNYTDTDPNVYDELGCLVEYNNLAEYHNRHLYEAIQELRVLYPNATLVYGDYYFAIRDVIRNAASLGFEEGAVLAACCGAGDNPYNYKASEFCGTEGVPVCPNPDQRISWDGAHYTQQLYKYVSDWMLKHTIIPNFAHLSSI